MWIALLIGMALIFATAYVGSPFLAINSLRTAATRGDQDKLDELVDYRAVRASLKDELSARLLLSMRHDPSMADNPPAAPGLLPAPAFVDGMIDRLVTPAAISRMVTVGRIQTPDLAAQKNPSALHVSYDYVSLDRFRNTIASQTNPRDSVGLIFERNNFFYWKLVRINLPLPETGTASTGANEASPKTNSQSAALSPDAHQTADSAPGFGPNPSARVAAQQGSAPSQGAEGAANPSPQASPPRPPAARPDVTPSAGVTH